MNKNQQAFLELMRAGLWENDIMLPFGEVDFSVLLQQAEDQSVVGLVAAGIEHIVDKKPQKKDVLQFIGRTVQLEQRNTAMNSFIGVLTEKLREKGISSVLVKGQGIAQCYERPLWRSSGDIDLLLDSENYEEAKRYLSSLSMDGHEEDRERLHFGITIDSWLVELHGTLHANHLAAMDRLLDEVQKDVLQYGRVRVWSNGAVDILLPASNEDIVFVFAHILQHFFKGGIGLRQICDWCRLLWTFRSNIDLPLLEARIRSMSMISKWKAFAALTVGYLGMPAESMPLYSNERKWKKMADRIMELIMESGSLGHRMDENKDEYGALVTGVLSFWKYTRFFLIQFSVFPQDAVKGWHSVIVNGVKAAIRKKTGR